MPYSVSCKSTRVKVLSPEGENELFDILAGVLQGDTLTHNLFAMMIDYRMQKAVNRDDEKLGLTLEHRKS
jgi:hypothetical protein